MPTPQIFISYRRDDTAGYARALCDDLARRFGAARVFMDVDDIAAGQAFGDVIQRAVGSSHVLLVLIGKRWLGERDGLPARISEPGDFVRREVESALARGLHVIPLLIDGAAMPSEAQLPDSLHPLAGLHALEIGNTRFAADMERLAQALHAVLGTPAPAPKAARRVVVGALTFAAVLAGAGWWLARPAGPVPRAAVNGNWQAEVVYDWPNARYTERFTLAGEGTGLHGSASFLGVPRGLLEGRVEAGQLNFVTRTQETGSSGSAEAVHRYQGRLVGEEIRFVMQTEGGSSAHLPIEFSARRVAPASAD
ncbi:MAG: toll/interleukin-1 receptor domain-containing protein [Vitreoscilla sp.]|nr:toll/interleukin-1 receptor domain-containing protein [Vitreoscilla sp.]